MSIWSDIALVNEGSPYPLHKKGDPTYMKSALDDAIYTLKKNAGRAYPTWDLALFYQHLIPTLSSYLYKLNNSYGKQLGEDECTDILHQSMLYFIEKTRKEQKHYEDLVQEEKAYAHYGIREEKVKRYGPLNMVLHLFLLNTKQSFFKHLKAKDKLSPFEEKISKNSDSHAPDLAKQEWQKLYQTFLQDLSSTAPKKVKQNLPKLHRYFKAKGSSQIRYDLSFISKEVSHSSLLQWEIKLQYQHLPNCLCRLGYPGFELEKSVLKLLYQKLIGEICHNGEL